jgi:hypothetical protein
MRENLVPAHCTHYPVTTELGSDLPYFSWSQIALFIPRHFIITLPVVALHAFGAVPIISAEEDCSRFPFPARLYAAGERGSTITNGDIDNDGDQDILVSNLIDGDLYMRVLLNQDGDLHLTETLYPASSFAKCRLVDMNGDGFLDFVNSRYNSPFFEIRFGVGDGTFSDRNSTSLGITYNLNFEITDLNNDGHADVIGTRESFSGNTFSYRLNDGSGSFGGTISIPNDFGAYGFSARDMNNDGLVDLITSDRSGQSISVRLNLGGMEFADPLRVSAGDFPREIDVCDLDNDGDLDVIAPAVRDNTVNLFINDGTGMLTRASDLVPGFTVGNTARAHDFDGDGYPEVVVANNFGNEVVTFKREKGSEYSIAQRLFTRADMYAVPFADLDGDALPDLLVNTLGDFEGVGYLSNNGDGTFSTFLAAPMFDIESAGNFDGDFEYADTNNDGVQDFSYCVSTLRAIFRVQRDPSGNLVSLGEIETQWEPAYFDVVDTNNDGVPDIAYVSAENESLNIMLGLGDGNFLPEIPSPSGSSTGDISAAHLNDDPYIDLVVPERNTTNFQKISVYFGTPSGIFFDRVTLPTLADPLYAACGDIDEDGDIDILGGRYTGGSNSVHVFLNNGDQTFTDFTQVSGLTFSPDLELADINNDSHLDILTLSPTNELVKIHLGNGDGTFPKSIILDAGEATDIEVADMNGDGLIDLVVSNSSGESISVYHGTSSGIFDERVNYHGGGVPGDIEPVDFDGDGRLDIASVNTLKGYLNVFVQSCVESQCFIDFNGDGMLNFFDVSAFLVFYLDQDAQADLNSDGAWDFFDVSLFLQEYQSGCP